MILLYTGIGAVVLVCITATVYYLLTNDTGMHAGPPAWEPAEYQPVSYEPYDWSPRPYDWEPYPQPYRPAVFPVTLGVLEAISRRADEIAAVRAQPTDSYLGGLARYEHSDATDSFTAIAATWNDDGESDEGDEAPLDDPFTPPGEWYHELDDAPLRVGGAR